MARDRIHTMNGCSCQQCTDMPATAVGGVLFLDEAYDLDPEHDPVGRAILAELMSAAEDHRDKVHDRRLCWDLVNR